MFSKIERGDRRAKREQVIQLASYFHVNADELLILWIAEKILNAVEGENKLSEKAIDVAKLSLINVNCDFPQER